MAWKFNIFTSNFDQVGAQLFTQLGDVPNSFVGQAGKVLVVNGTETGIVFTSEGLIDDHKVLVSGTDTTPNYLGSKLVAGTGITLTTNLPSGNSTISIINNLSTGIAGGQAAIGGTAVGNSLTLRSTTSSTKGKIFFGTVGASQYDEQNNRWNLGGTAGPNYTLVFTQQSTTDGLNLTGIGNTGGFGGTGFILTLGFNQTGNKQLWFGDTDFLGNVNSSYTRYITFAGVSYMDAISGTGSTYRPLIFGGLSGTNVVIGNYHSLTNLPTTLAVIARNTSVDSIGQQSIAEFLCNNTTNNRARVTITNTNVGSGTSSAISFVGDDGVGYSARAEWEIGSDYFFDATQTFYILDASNGILRVLVNESGFVGINTATPGAFLSVVGPSQVFGGQSTHFELTTGSGAPGDNKLFMGVHNSDYSWIQASQPGTAFRNLLLNPGGGNVSIGTSNASSRFNVVGLPTSSAGLTSGGIWVDTTGGLNILKIV